MIVVVSGLPRSGTSLMMQMLQAGGYPVLCDDQRVADENNPRGYLEYEKVRRLERDSSWLAEAEGRAVKIVSLLLYSLPQQFEYRILFLRRSLDEIQQSQAAMLQRNQPHAIGGVRDLRSDFERHLQHLKEWWRTQMNMSVQECDYAEIIHSPRKQAAAVAQFLNAPLDLDAMAAAVDPTLHRQRTA